MFTNRAVDINQVAKDSCTLYNLIPIVKAVFIMKSTTTLLRYICKRKTKVVDIELQCSQLQDWHSDSKQGVNSRSNRLNVVLFRRSVSRLREADLSPSREFAEHICQSVCRSIFARRLISFIKYCGWDLMGLSLNNTGRLLFLRMF